MTIPKLAPYTGEVANPDGSQTQSEFTTNMFNQLNYEANLATELDATIDGMNNAVDETNATATSAESSAIAAEAAASSAGYQGLWPDTGGSALKGETYQTQVGGVPTGDYYTALQNTSINPVGDNVNWKAQNDYGVLNSGLSVRQTRGSNAQIMATVLEDGRIVKNNDDGSIHMGDGVTHGGIKHINYSIGDWRYTPMFKNNGSTSAVQNMIDGKIGGVVSVVHRDGNRYRTGGTCWEVKALPGGIDIGSGLYIHPKSDIYVDDFGAISLDKNITTAAIQDAVNLASGLTDTNGIVVLTRGVVYDTNKPITIPCGVTLTDYQVNTQGMGATIRKTTNSTEVASGYPTSEGGKSNEQDSVLIYVTTFGSGYIPGTMNNLAGKGLLSVNLRSTANCEFAIYGYSINSQDFKHFQIFDVQEGYFSWNSWKQNWENVLIQDVDRIGTWEYDGIINTTMHFRHMYMHSYRQRAIKFVQCKSVVMDIPIWENGEGQQLIAEARTSVVCNGIHIEYAGTLNQISGVPVSDTAHFYANSTSSILINGGYMQTYFNPTPAGGGGESAIFYAQDISKITVNELIFDVSKAIGLQLSEGVAFTKVDERSTVAINNITPLNTQAEMLGGGATVANGGSVIVNGGNLTRTYLLKRLGFPCSDAETSKAESPIDAYINPVSGKAENNGTSSSPKKTFTQVFDIIRHCNSSDLPSMITLIDSDVGQDLNIDESTIPITIDLGGYSINNVNITNSKNVTIKNGSVNTANVINSECELESLTYRNLTNNIQASKQSVVNIKGNTTFNATSTFNVQAFDGSRINQYAGIVTGRFAVQTYGGIVTVSSTPTATDENGGGKVYS